MESKQNTTNKESKTKRANRPARERSTTQKDRSARDSNMRQQQRKPSEHPHSRNSRSQRPQSEQTHSKHPRPEVHSQEGAGEKLSNAGQAAGHMAQNIAQAAANSVGAVASETMQQVHKADEMLDNEREAVISPVERVQRALGIYNPNTLSDLYTRKTGGGAKGYSFIYTLSPARLLRKQKLTGMMFVPVALCVIVASAIAFNVYGWADANILNANEQATRKVSEQLSTIQDITLPTPATFIDKDDETIASAVLASDAQIYRATSSDASVTLMLYRIPPTLNVAVGQTEITQGISSLSPADAAKLLNGLWQFEVTRANGTCAMRFRYADFKSGGVAAAVTSAMAAQGLGEDTVVDEGVDDSGNTYKAGKIVINDTQVSWRISTVPLSDMYSVKGLPEGSSYVGIRYSY